MTRFQAEIKKVQTGKPYGDPRAVVTLEISDIETIAYLALLALQENSIVELGYEKK